MGVKKQKTLLPYHYILSTTQVSTEVRYYISSLASHAANIAAAIRTHWTVENHLHLVLNVSCAEDACRIRKDHAPQNLSLLRQVALNLLGHDKSTKAGIADKRKKAGWLSPQNSGSIIFLRLP